LKVLLSAYACSPIGGSEFGVGWDSACALAEHHDVIVLTRTVFRTEIEAELKRQPRKNLSFVYFDLPASVQRFGFGDPFKPTQFYYILWQRGILRVAKEILSKNDISIIHHVTFVKYWAPSFLVTLPRPFVWGPVGGGEVAPRAFWKSFSLRGKIYELLRDCARFLQERNPNVCRTAKNAAVALATSAQTAERIRKIGAERVEVYPAIGMPIDEVRTLESIKSPDPNVFRFVSIGRLLHWKGFHLGISAFAKAAIPNAEYWIVGDGPERGRLKALAECLGVADRVHFWGQLPRDMTLEKLAKSDVLVHPSLHESGGGVCLEAMSSGCPVICLDIGGPGVLVDENSGILVEATNPASTEAKLAEAMGRMAADRDRCARMGEAGRRLVHERYLWPNKARHYSALYQKILIATTANSTPAD
jgi:glycosyltransferase involved in cell wall biosynthesis